MTRGGPIRLVVPLILVALLPLAALAQERRSGAEAGAGSDASADGSVESGATDVERASDVDSPDTAMQARHRGAREGRSGVRFSLRVGDYNRVEGLPLYFGPVLRTGGRNPIRAEARLVWRSQGRPAFATDRLGWEASASRPLWNRGLFRLGAGAHSTIDPIESSGLTDRENLLSTLLIGTDHRDYVERTGWNVHLGVTPSGLPLEGRLAYRRQRDATVGAGDPWSLFTPDRSWRAQPIVAEGDRDAIVATLELDTRKPRRDDGAGGWLVRAEWDRGIGGSLALPSASAPEGAPGGERASSLPAMTAEFTTASLDLRRYQPLGRRSGIALRGMVAGTPGEGILPPQYQRALGGEGSLPGHSRFAVDCGARASSVRLDRGGVSRVMHPFYGCDRVALAQVEYRGPLGFELEFGREEEASERGHRHGRRGASWAVFFDAGRGWATEGWNGVERGDSKAIYDAGLGLLFESAGLYWAVPLGEGERGSTFTLRLDRRF